MRRLASFSALLLLAACGGGAEDDDGAGKADTNQITRLSTPPSKVKDERATVRLQPLTAADLAAAGMGGTGCAFSIGDRMLLAARAGDAIVRIEGELRHLAQSAPPLPSGGFFEDRQLSISVGRADEASAGTNSDGRRPARLTVTNRRAEIDQDLFGAWTCSGQTPP
ncbi:MAG: hypothetical protein ACXWUX_10015 [Allosphingosinicella sp.]